MLSAAALYSYVFAGDPFVDGPSGDHRDASAGIPNIKAQTPIVDPRDSALTVRLLAGEERAVDDLVSAYADALIRFAYVMIGSRDVAEGLAYDVLADVWEHRARLRPDRSLKTYLFTALRRRAANEAARQRVRERYAERIHAAPADAGTAPSPDDLLSEQDAAMSFETKLDVLRRAIATLSARRRLGLHLRFEQGLSYSAMGEILGVSDKGAQQLVLRALDTLRRILGV